MTLRKSRFAAVMMLITALMLAFSACAFADATVVTTEDELLAAISAAATDGTEAEIQLGADITGITDRINIYGSRNIILDLNGYTIEINRTGYGIYIYGGATLTVEDSSEDESGAITNDSGTTVRVGQGSASKGYFILNSGTISGSKAVYINAGSFTMNGGTVTGTLAIATTGTSDNTEVDVTGGTVIGTGKAISINKGAATISGTATIEGEVSDGQGTVDITGGIYTDSSVLSYLDDDVEYVYDEETGIYYVGEEAIAVYESLGSETIAAETPSTAADDEDDDDSSTGGSGGGCNAGFGGLALAGLAAISMLYRKSR